MNTFRACERIDTYVSGDLRAAKTRRSVARLCGAFVARADSPLDGALLRVRMWRVSTDCGIIRGALKRGSSWIRHLPDACSDWRFAQAAVVACWRHPVVAAVRA